MKVTEDQILKKKALKCNKQGEKIKPSYLCMIGISRYICGQIHINNWRVMEDSQVIGGHHLRVQARLSPQACLLKQFVFSDKMATSRKNQ